VEALRAMPGVDVRVAGRSGEVRVDLNDPSTFGALDADVLVDLANTSIAPPYELAKHCIENGKVLLEATSWFLGIYFTVLRRVLLSWKATPVEMVAIADGRKMTVLAPDGMRAGGEAIARMCQLLAQRKPDKPVIFVDDVMTLEELKVPGVIVGH
jgi:hypothetical protein